MKHYPLSVFRYPSAVVLLALALDSFAVAQTPVARVGGIVNTADYSGPGVAPGSDVSIFGANLAGQTATANSLPLPTTLGGVTSVTFNGVPAALFFVSPSQINVQVPFNEPALATVNVVVTNGAGSSAPQPVQILTARPGIFTVGAAGSGQAIATDNSTGALAAPGHPIQIGSYLVVWCTGLGAVDAAMNTLATPAVLIGGVQASLIYSVLSPQYAGEYQVAVQVAPGTPTGNSVPLQIQVNGITTRTGITIAVAPGPVTMPPFNYLDLSGSFIHFTPGTTTLPGIPTHAFSAANVRPQVGYQGGDFVNGMAIYPPWQVQPVSSAGGTISSGVPQGVVLAYIPANDPFDSNSANPPQWVWYDMQSNPAYSSTCPSANPGRGGVYCPVGYNSGIVAGNSYYLVPADVNQFPVFVRIDTAAAEGIGSAAAYSFVSGTRSTFGTPGWATGIYDGRQYIYYAPTVTNGNIVRHDTTQDSNGISATGWAHFDPSAGCSPIAYPLLQHAKGYLSSTWDGHRYIYFVTNQDTFLIRYDTSGDFNSCASYTGFDMSLLGLANQPGLTGNGLARNLHGFGGAVVGMSGDAKQYLYLIPWTASRSNESIVLSSTCARVQVGAYSNGVWSATDLTSPTAMWEAFDLSSLAANTAWAGNNLGPAFYGSSLQSLQGQSVIAGFQLGWVNLYSGYVGFGAGDAQFWVLHNPAGALNDASSWTVAPVDKTMGNQNYGGPYDAVHQQFYPSSPFATVLVQVTGL